MYLSLVLHAHQPPGNFDSVFEDGIRTCYGPVLDLIEERPRLRLSMHWSGSLLEWMETHTPDRIEQLRRLVERGQVELVAAGMYEPVLSLLPRRDRVGQVQAHRAYLQRLFGVDATVGWLTERVWEPSLASDLVEGGLRAVTLDDRHFLSAGITEDALGVPYRTEHQGHPLVVAPGVGAMRAAIPWATVDEALAVVQRARAAGSDLVVYGDDIEKFGMWPETYRTVIQSGWLARFLDGLVDLDGVEVLPLGEAIDRSTLGPRVYIPDGSYPEMLDWTLPARRQREVSQIRGVLSELGLADTVGPLIRIGIYHQFLAKYPEVNHLHKRMLDVSRRCSGLLRRGDSRDPQDLPEAVRELWRAQANCAYWHGMFGGIYLPHIRQRLWFHLLRAEQALDAAGRNLPPVRVFDLDADGDDEIIVTTPDLVVVADPNEGCLVELSHRPSAVNVTDTIARREEAYHDPEAPPYPYDVGRRGMFVDRLLAPGRPPGRRSDVADLGGLAGSAYATRVRRRAGHTEIRMERTAEDARAAVDVQKVIRVFADEPVVDAAYSITASGQPLKARFATELNLGILFRQRRSGAVRFDGATRSLPGGGAARGVQNVTIEMDGVPVTIDVSITPPSDVDVRPIETVSRSEAGFEHTPQQLAVLVSWPADLEAGASLETSVSVRLTSREQPS